MNNIGIKYSTIICRRFVPVICTVLLFLLLIKKIANTDLKKNNLLRGSDKLIIF